MQSLIHTHAHLLEQGVRLSAVALAACLVNKSRLPGMLLAAQVVPRRPSDATARPNRADQR